MPFSPADVPAITTWMLDAPHTPDGGLTFMRELIEQLQARGLLLLRCSFSLYNKHPEVLWRNVQWSEAEGARGIDMPYAIMNEAFYTNSPVAELRRGGGPIRVKLDGDDLRFPICHELKALGGTDYFGCSLKFSTGQLTFISWATRAVGGFSDEALKALDALRPVLARRLELESAYHATTSLLEVYLGHNAAQRVGRGDFHRGGGELIHAAIWFCDLRNFTSMSDSRPPLEVVQTLDAYFDRVAGPLMAHGGEVLKFVGDAILAIFPVAGDPKRACDSALLAAREALAALESLNGERAARHQDPLAIGIALHLGEVMYGNIGTQRRLDFTVISAAVNEACRLESLCKELGTPLAISEPFVDALSVREVVDLGVHRLKGVSAPVHVFTLRDFT